MRKYVLIFLAAAISSFSLNSAEAILSSLISVVEYDPEWPALFEKEAADVRRVLGDNCLAVHHVGSSSVPTLGGKPILDMAVEVRDLALVDGAALGTLSYQFFGEAWLPLMRFFLKPEAGVCYKIHVFEAGNPEIARLVSFRDYLRAHPEARAEYEALKRGLVEKHSGSIADYSKGKNEFVARVDELTGVDVPRIGFAFSPAHKAVAAEMLGAAGEDMLHEFVLANGTTIFAVARISRVGNNGSEVLTVKGREAGRDTELEGIVRRWAHLQKRELSPATD